jgi:hypothetical protein
LRIGAWLKNRNKREERQEKRDDALHRSSADDLQQQVLARS